MTQRSRASWQPTAAVAIVAIATTTVLFFGISPRWDFLATILLQRTAPLPDIPAALLVLLGNAEIMIPAIGVVGGAVFWRNRRLAVQMFWLAGVLGIISLLAVGLKFLMMHPGPPPSLERHVFDVGLSVHTPGSFPSGHTMRTTFLAAMVLRGQPVLTWLLVGAMMFGLVYLGDHWLSDVLGGLILGWTCAFLMTAVKPDSL